MEGQSLAIIIVATLSILGNIIQYLLNKKSNDIKNLRERINLMDSIQDKQTKIYGKDIENQNGKIKELQIKLGNQDIMLKQNKEEIIRLEKIVNNLIRHGCHEDECPNRSPYTTEELNEMTKKNNKNEKSNNGNKK